jgi:hypothetical protein
MPYPPLVLDRAADLRRSLAREGKAFQSAWGVVFDLHTAYAAAVKIRTLERQIPSSAGGYILRHLG